MTDAKLADRPSWDLTWMRMARVIARRSLCDGEKVGAVITSATNRIVAVGYNNPPAGFGHQGRPCLAWCPRRQDSQRVVGYESDDKLMLSAKFTVTEWESTYDGVFVTIDDNYRFNLSETNRADMDAIMASCGFKPRYGGGGGSYANCPSLHAEANALSVCDRAQREDGTIYTTSVPCMDCAKLIANSGIAIVVYRDTPRGRERERRDESPLAFLSECGVGLVQL